jgi:N-methylhydantoinase A
MRLSTDTGGTFTDLVLEDDSGGLWLHKVPTTPSDPIQGVLNVVGVAADSLGVSVREFLAGVTSFMHGTTHALNAVVTGRTARTALITTRGHRDILVFREGGRREPFNHTRPYPRPYVPRSLTFELDERVTYDGSVVVSLRDDSVLAVIEQLRGGDVQAVAVCLLWSVVNSTHERRIGELLAKHLPGIPFTLSCELNPVLREYRRASASAIDASLKPLVTRYIGELSSRLAELGYTGDVRILTSLGGLKAAHEVAAAPIQLLKSGPSTAPVAGRFYGRSISKNVERDLIVTDAGGTTYDVSLVRLGEIAKSRDTWIGQEFLGHLTGFPSVDVKSIGAGGGSVAWVDNGGVLHVGPQSQGADPGPACYGKGGREATVTDAAVVLGYLDPDYFLGGRIRLDRRRAVDVIASRVAEPLGLGDTQAAAALFAVATENMAQAIFDLTMEKGVDVAGAILIGGGGAAGLNSMFIARRLQCPTLVFPEVGAALSAAGAVFSDVTAQYSKVWFTSTKRFDRNRANELLDGLRASCHEFAQRAGFEPARCRITYTVEARYRNQVWEIEVPLRSAEFGEMLDVTTFVDDFHANHKRLFAVADPNSPIEVLSWTATIACPVRTGAVGRLRSAAGSARAVRERRVHLPGVGIVVAPVIDFSSLALDESIPGPAVVESPCTSIIVDERARYTRRADGSLVVDVCASRGAL